MKNYVKNYLSCQKNKVTFKKNKTINEYNFLSFKPFEKSF